MNGEIPSVPITTLAGVASLTDLLPELPLPSPLPSSVANKSLLFHPRVAEEARRLLNLRDEPLANQLVNALAQTNIDHVELKDSYVGSDCLGGEFPELLKAILQRNPQTLKDFNIQSLSNRHPMPPTATTLVPFFPPHPSNYTQHSPYPSHLSPYTSQLSPPRYTPQGSPVKFPQDSPDTRPRSTSQVNGSTATPTPPTLKQEPLSPVTHTRSKSRANSPAQAAPLTPCAQQSVLNSECDKKPHPMLLPPPQPQPVTKRKPSLTEPVVVLNKLTIESWVNNNVHTRNDVSDEFGFGGVCLPSSTTLLQEQVLAQKSVREFSLKTPVPSAAGAVVVNCKAQTSPRSRRQSFGSDRGGRSVLESSSESENSDEPFLGKKKKDRERCKDSNFKTKAGDKSLVKRQRSSDGHPFDAENSFDNRLDSVVSSLTERVKRRKRSSAHKSYVESPDRSDAEQLDGNSEKESPVTASPMSPLASSLQRRKLLKKEKVRKKATLDEDLTPDGTRLT